MEYFCIFSLSVLCVVVFSVAVVMRNSGERGV